VTDDEDGRTDIQTDTPFVGLLFGRTCWTCLSPPLQSAGCLSRHRSVQWLALYDWSSAGGYSNVLSRRLAGYPCLLVSGRAAACRYRKSCSDDYVRYTHSVVKRSLHPKQVKQRTQRTQRSERSWRKNSFYPLRQLRLSRFLRTSLR